MAYHRGHTTGHKKERLLTTPPWYAALEEAQIREVEAAWAAAHAHDDRDLCGYCGASALDNHVCAGYAADLAYEAERERLVAEWQAEHPTGKDTP